MASDQMPAVLRRLLHAGVLTAAEVVDHGVRTVDTGRSNDVAVVLIGQTRRLVVKTARPGAGQWEQGDVAVERRLLGALGQRGSPFPPVHALPEDMLVTRYVEGGATVTALVRDGQLQPSGAARVIGTALGRLRSSDVSHTVVASLPTDLPWGLRLLLGDPPRFVLEHPAALALHVELLERRHLVAALELLAAQWSWTDLVHGDLRWDNCLLDRTTGEVVLVDWECAARGDPAWDLGCAVAEHFVQGPLAPGAWCDDPGALAESALRELTHPLRVLTDSFLDAAGAASSELVPRAAGYACARLLHVAFQWTYWDLNLGPDTARIISTVVEALLGRPCGLRDVLTGATA